MANNSTPKLKVYRLDNSNYNEARDNDIRSMTDDEMIPIVSKDLNPFNTEEMVGVVARQDARLVRESKYSYARMVEAVESANGYIETTGRLMCDGWVLGKGNFHVYVHRQLASGGTDTTTSGSTTTPETTFTYDGTNGNIVDIYNPVSELGEAVTLKNLKDSESPSADATDDGKWIELDRRFWDYTITTEKSYLDSTDGYVFSNPSAGCKIHDVNCITFRIGNILLNGNRFFSTGYNQYIPIVGDSSKNAIIIVYKKYCELGGYFTSSLGSSSSSGDLSSSSSSSTMPCFEDYQLVANAGAGSITEASSAYRVPFGNIYNGNKNGRAINKGTGALPSIVNLLDGNETTNKNEMNYYEGNYHYRKKAYPFRVKVLQQEAVTSDFICDGSTIDVCHIVNGKSFVPCELSWFMDDIMKPVVFERMPVDIGTDDERLIFKKLTKNQVTIQYQSTDGDHYAVTLSSKYYLIGNTYSYPEELFLVYNYNDDSLGNLFDFNYDYMDGNFTTRSLNTGYGYANNGVVSASSYSGSTGTEIYLKREILVSTEDCPMHDTARDLVMTNANDEISFTIPSDATGFTANVDDTQVVANEKARVANGIANIDTSMGLRLYYKGTKIWDSSEESSSSSSESSSSSGSSNATTIDIGGNTCSLSFDTDTFTITKISNDADAIDFDFIVELMLVYYEKRDMGFAAVNSTNPYCIGIRIPCYEKVKTSKLFVSSFPNWVKGHVNNDLDVFYGNRLYSGTEIVGSGLEDYHDIYPEYVKDGWYAMYAEGAIEFNEEKTEWDYFDVLNYGSLGSNDVTSIEWSFASTWNVYTNSTYTGLMPNYWADASKRALLYKKVKYNVARYDGIYSVVRGRMSNVSNATGESVYALVEDDDFADYGDKRWLVRNDDNLRRVFESGHEELPIIANVNGIETPEVLDDTNLRNGDVVILGTDSDRISVLSMPGGSHAILLVDSRQNQFQNNITAADIDTDMERIHIKVTDNSDTPKNCLAIGLETSTTFNGTDSAVLFNETNTPVTWTYFPDNEDAFIGEVNEYGDSYNSIGIECVQTKEITIDAENRAYWYADETEDDATSLPTNGIAPLKDVNGAIDYAKGTVRRYRYRNHDDSNWGYDIFFEVFSYRYSGSLEFPYNGIMNTPLSLVEIVAYRKIAE